MQPCTTIAGRHAADRQRALSAKSRLESTVAAFAELTKLLRTRPLSVQFGMPGASELPTIAVKVRLEYCGVDYLFIEAALNEQGWTRSVEQMSRQTGKYDIRVLDHAASGARLLLIITLPHGEVEHVEAA